MAEIYDASEQELLMQVFADLLRSATKDGGEKRARGEKPPWWRDLSHEAAIFSHLDRWKHGEFCDKDSGAHPLVHFAWRALAIAYQETYGKRDPKGFWPYFKWVVSEPEVIYNLEEPKKLLGYRVGFEDSEYGFVLGLTQKATGKRRLAWVRNPGPLTREEADHVVACLEKEKPTQGWEWTGVYEVYANA
jgi:hypothetical protein